MYLCRFCVIKVWVMRMEEIKKRKPTRLKNFDYNKIGAYFITICPENRRQILSNINVGGNIQGCRNLFLLSKDFATKSMDKTFGKDILTTTLFVTVRITRSIFGISTKILCGGFMTNYIRKNNKKGTVSVRFLFVLCNFRDREAASS